MTTQTAATGNPMIPTHPSIQAQRATAQAQVPSQAPNGQQPATPAAEQAGIDWGNLAAGLDEEFGNPQTLAQAPAQQQQGQPQQAAPAQVPPEQMEAIARANMETQAQSPQTAQQQQQMSLEEASAAAEQHLLSSTYALTPEQKKQLISEPDVAIPQLAARMHVQIATQLAQYMHQAMQQVVPQMALTAMNRQMGAFKAEQAFFGQYPALNRPEFRSVVLQSLKLAKAYAPNATRDQVMKDAAELAAFKLKVNLTQQASQQSQPPQQRQQAPAPFTPAQMPFAPAASGGAPASTQGQPQAENIFAELAADQNW